MTNPDIIAQAEAWCNATVTAPLETEPELCIDGASLLPQLLAEAKDWKAKAIEERAILKGRYLNDIITEIHDDWIDVKESTKMAFRKQAACELEEEMKQDE